jgi:choline-sulfatase
VTGAAAAHVVSEMTELFDIMPTMLELAGTRPQHAHFARSLVAQLRGSPGDVDRAAFSEGGYNLQEPQVFEPILPGIYEPKTRLQNEHPEMIARCVSVRTRTHKLIVRPGGQSELYDCRTDPELANNLIDDVASASKVQQLREQLLEWYVTTSGVPATDRDPRGLPPFER